MTKLLGEPNAIEVVETILNSGLDDRVETILRDELDDSFEWNDAYLRGEIDEIYTSSWLIGVAIHANIDGAIGGGE